MKEGRKEERIERGRLKECIPGWMWCCLPEAEDWRHSPKKDGDKEENEKKKKMQTKKRQSEKRQTEKSMKWCYC